MTTYSIGKGFNLRKTFSPLFASDQSSRHLQESDTFYAPELCVFEGSLPAVAICIHLSDVEATNLILYDCLT